MTDFSEHIGHVFHGIPAFLRENWHWLAGVTLALYWMSIQIWRRLTEDYVTESHMNACKDEIIRSQRADAQANLDQHIQIVRDLNEGLTTIRRDMIALHSGKFVDDKDSK